jgi:hypothetical protein
MKLRALTRIVKEDFEQEHQEIIGKLATALNPLLEQFSQIMDKNIDFDNLNQVYTTITISVDQTGKPTDVSELTNSLKSKPRGILCLSARNLTDSTYPKGTPFISYSFSGSSYDTIKINNIGGLNDSTGPTTRKYELGLILIA